MANKSLSTVATETGTETELTTELSTAGQSSINIDTFSTTPLDIDEATQGSKYMVYTVITLSVLFMTTGKIFIPILITLTFAFEFFIVDAWFGDYDPIEVATCNNMDNQCDCKGNYASECNVDLESSFLEASIALNTMAFIVEFLWFIRMIYGCHRHSFRSKLGILTAIGQLTRDSKCCLFVWRLFELAYYLWIIAQFHLLEDLECFCIGDDGDGGFKWTQKGVFYRLSRHLDFSIVGSIGVYLVTKGIFFCLMGKMMASAGAYYDMGAFWAVLKVEYMDRASLYEDSVSVWSPLKQERMLQEDVKYTSKQLKLHYKSWR